MIKKIHIKHAHAKYRLANIEDNHLPHNNHCDTKIYQQNSTSAIYLAVLDQGANIKLFFL